MIKYLTQKNKNYWYRRKVTHFGEIVFSLKTKNYDIAMIRHAYIDYQIKKILHKGYFETMDISHIKKLINTYKEYMLTTDYNDFEDIRDQELTVTINGKRYGGHTAEALDHAIMRYKNIHAQNDISLVQQETNKILQRSKLQEEYNALKTAKEKEVFHWELLKNEIDILSQTSAKQKKLFSEIAQQNQSTPYAPNQIEDMFKALYDNDPRAPKTLNDTTISLLIQNYILEKEKTNNWSDKNVRDLEYVFKHLMDYFNDCAISALTREDFSEFRDTVLVNLPKQITKNIFIGKSTREIIDISKKEKLEKIGKTTINKHLRRLHQVFEWAYNNDKVDRNLTKDLDFKKTKAERNKKTPKLPYTDSELKLLFEESPWFNEDIEKTMQTRPEYIFIPLLCLFTGARPTEVATLKVSDINKKDGIFGIDFKEHVKTSYSIRFTPLSQTLINLDFLKFVNYQKKKKITMLFPSVRAYKGGGSNFTNKYTIYNRAHISTEKDKTFYSLRHLINQKFKNNKIDLYTMNDITGHSSGGGNKAIEVYGDEHMPPRYTTRSYQ